MKKLLCFGVMLGISVRGIGRDVFASCVNLAEAISS